FMEMIPTSAKRRVRATIFVGAFVDQHAEKAIGNGGRPDQRAANVIEPGTLPFGKHYERIEEACRGEDIDMRLERGRIDNHVIILPADLLDRSSQGVRSDKLWGVGL